MSPARTPRLFWGIVSTLCPLCDLDPSSRTPLPPSTGSWWAHARGIAISQLRLTNPPARAFTEAHANRSRSALSYRVTNR